MTKEDFRRWFEAVLETAAANAEKRLGRSVPRSFALEVHGLAPERRTLSKEVALDEIYLGPDRSYRIIDLAVRRVSADVTTVFMRVSGHPPGGFGDAWNQPVGSGPFKQLMANDIVISRE